MTLLEALKPYISSEGLVNAHIGVNQGNDQVILALANFALDQNGEELLPYAKYEEEMIAGEGLVGRGQGSSDQQSIDNYVAIAGLAALRWKTDPRNFFEAPLIPCSIIQYGKKNAWVFNTENPKTIFKKDGKTINWSALFIRFQGPICHFYYALEARTPVLRRIAWVGGIILSGLFTRKDQDGWYEAWIQIKTHPNPSTWLVDWWNWRLKKYWPGGMRDVLSGWLNNPLHPIVTNWREI